MRRSFDSEISMSRPFLPPLQLTNRHRLDLVPNSTAQTTRIKAASPMPQNGPLEPGEWKSFLHELRSFHGKIERRTKRDTLDSLVEIILSQSTLDSLSEQAYRSLKSSFPSWESAMQAGPSKIEERIRVGGLSRQKASRIHRILLDLKIHFGELTLRPLDDMDRKTAWEYLLSFDGIGPKTAACVLLFACGRSAFPIDTHVSRVAYRVGLLPKQTATVQDHERLRLLVPRHQHYVCHRTLVLHGRALCRPSQPECTYCPIQSWCRHSHCPARRSLLQG